MQLKANGQSKQQPTMCCWSIGIETAVTDNIVTMTHNYRQIQAQNHNSLWHTTSASSKCGKYNCESTRNDVTSHQKTDVADVHARHHYVLLRFHDTDIDTDSPDMPTSLCPTRAISSQDSSQGCRRVGRVGEDVVECGLHWIFSHDDYFRAIMVSRGN